MKHIKSHFRFSKGQRNGIFLLIVLIIILQGIYFFVKYSFKPPELENQEILKFQQEVDSLKLVKPQTNAPKLFPFNPNYITDHKGYTLGMSPGEIDRLLQFRAESKWINSAEDFQSVTGVSDSLLAAISPYFKFPDWVTNPKVSNPTTNKFSTSKTSNQKIDLNLASQEQLINVNGIGEKLSERIIEYRSRQANGFIDGVELKEIYGLKDEVIEELLKHFFVSPPADFETININQATRDELVKIKYVDYELAHHIIEYRTLHEGFKSLDELTKVKFFPVNKYEIIKLYLRLN
ncbi:DNA uptake protein ComE [Flavobacteriaceae bacterium MAR_2010_188]|nr:DNA uptake protein ComE [Flavobacteriaceae bacterium MAR_2010_188]